MQYYPEEEKTAMKSISSFAALINTALEDPEI